MGLGPLNPGCNCCTTCEDVEGIIVRKNYYGDDPAQEEVAIPFDVDGFIDETVEGDHTTVSVTLEANVYQYRIWQYDDGRIREQFLDQRHITVTYNYEWYYVEQFFARKLPYPYVDYRKWLYLPTTAVFSVERTTRLQTRGGTYNSDSYIFEERKCGTFLDFIDQTSGPGEPVTDVTGTTTFEKTCTNFFSSGSSTNTDIALYQSFGLGLDCVPVAKADWDLVVGFLGQTANKLLLDLSLNYTTAFGSVVYDTPCDNVNAGIDQIQPDPAQDGPPTYPVTIKHRLQHTWYEQQQSTIPYKPTYSLVGTETCDEADATLFDEYGNLINVELELYD